MRRELLGLAVAGLLVADAGAVVRHVPAAYPTIQAAVDAAAAGDTVAVAAGTYEEQVVVDVNIALVGAGRGLTWIAAPVGMTDWVGSLQNVGVVSVEPPATQVTVADLGIDGLGRHPEVGRFIGLVYYNVAGHIARVGIRNLHATPIDDRQTGVGLMISEPFSGSPVTVTVEDVAITRFQKAGMTIAGGACTALVSQLLVDADGLYADAVQNGLELSSVGHVILHDCTIRGVYYDGTPYTEYTSCGVLGYYTADLQLRDCIVDKCQAGIYLVHAPTDLERVTIATRFGDTTYCHGLIGVGAVYYGSAAGGEILPIPRAFAAPDEPSRPQTLWHVRARDCVLDGKGRPSSRGFALRGETAAALEFIAERCLVQDWETGVIALEESIGAVYGRLSGCRLVGNQSWGIYAATLTPVDARGSWWGDATGPYHPILNPFGLGDTASDHVLFDPWLRGNLAPLPVPQVISLADHDGSAYADTVTVEYLGGGGDLLYGFSAGIAWDPAVVTAIAIERPARGAFAQAVLFEVLPEAGGATVDAALGGVRPGIASGPLFTVRFAAVGTPDWTSCPVQLTLHHARNNRNEELGGFTADAGAIDVDLQPPVVHSLAIRNDTLPHTDDYAKNGDLLSVSAQITDGDPAFDRAGIRGVGAMLYGAPYMYYPPDSYGSGQAYWAPRPATLTPADGDVAFWAEARDPSGNYSPYATDSLTADNTRPLPVTGLVAVTGHNEVALAWNDPAGGDLHYRRTAVRANHWGDYPFYDGSAPAYPATPAQGEAVYLGLGTAVTATYPADGSGRDILYFAARAEDLAGNVSPLDAGSCARATNYRLGDVRGHPVGSYGDGVIDIYDVTRLGDTYTLLRGDAGFDGDCDVGPADGGATGIPVPDEEIGFEDLMIFATQFDVDNAPAPAPPGDAPPQLVWQRVAPEAWALVLAAPCPRLKGVHLVSDADGVALRLVAGPVLAAQPGPWFLRPGRISGEAHLAVLGAGVGIAGAGELLRLVADEPVELPVPTVTLRDVDNAPLTSALPTAVDADPAVPAVFRAGRPYPNPCNPSTELSFDLPSRADVLLAVYGLDGRRVATLLAGPLPAGRHAARWHGCDETGRPVAAGTYLYRLVAGPWTATGKLQLIK